MFKLSVWDCSVGIVTRVLDGIHHLHLHVEFLLVLLLDLENGGNMFLRNITSLSLDYMTVYLT
jgi:hypothetical protein